MAVTTLRVSEVMGRSLDKGISASSTKSTPAPASTLAAPFTSDGPREASAFRAMDRCDQDGRSSNPEERVAASVMASETVVSIAVPQASPDIVQPVESAFSAPTVVLESCPSFSEQNAANSKPLWLERHQTLQRAYDSFLQKSGRRTEGGASTTSSSSSADDLTRYLPSWEIARSNLWLLVETMLLLQEQRTHQPQPEGPAAHSSPGAHTTKSPTNTHHHTHLAHHHVHGPHASGHSHSHNHSHSHHPRLACVMEDDDECEDQAGDAGTGGDTAAADLPSQFAQLAPEPAQAAGEAKSSASLPDLGSALARFRSITRQLLPAPLGLGPSPLMRSPSLSLASMRLEGRGNAGKTGSPHKRVVAFAAGLTAAASTAAAVSSAAGIATSGMAAALPIGGAGALALGSKALNAGASVLADKVQDHITKRVTALVAEAVLGEEAHPSARDQLVARVQATLAGASILWFLFNLTTMSDSLAHLDFEHDFATSAKLVLDLATSGPGLMENCKDLMQIGVAVGLGVANRTASQSAGDGVTLARTLSELGSTFYSVTE